MKNDYYEIAINNLRYLEVTLHTPYYNEISVGAQQVVEKMLKSVLEQLVPATDAGKDKLMHSHNLRALYDKIHELDSTFNLDRRGLSMLKDYYYDAKYPGDSFITVTKDECTENVEIMYDAVDAVNAFRKRNGLEVIGVKRQELKSMNCF